jgi:hypothetical protein
MTNTRIETDSLGGVEVPRASGPDQFAAFVLYVPHPLYPLTRSSTPRRQRPIPFPGSTKPSHITNRPKRWIQTLLTV